VKKYRAKIEAMKKAGKDLQGHDNPVYAAMIEETDRSVGTWGWALWPAPKGPADVDRCINTWLKNNKKNGYKLKGRPKDTLVLSAGGKVKSGFYKGYFWSRDALMSSDQGHALRMIKKTVSGVEFLLVEKGGFGKANGKSDWHCGYHGYVRLKK
jgi:hypothetical protein